jgi:haloalkane dehalogenase
MVTDDSLFKSEYPFESHYLNLNGLRYHYLDEGRGEPLVLVHGNPSWSFYYRDLVKELSCDYRLIVPDHIGCGLSDKPADTRYDYHLERRVEDLDALISHLDLQQKITLVVHDWGGMIGMAWAVRNPERIARLVILNTAAFRLPEIKQFPLALNLCRNTMFGAFLVRGCNAFALGAAWVGCKRKRMSPQLRKLYCAPYDSWQNRIATLRFIQDIPLKEGDRGYELISQVEAGLEQFRELPMLICWGEQDFVFDRHFLKGWRDRFPQAIVHSFAECGHYILEDAKEDVLPLIRLFLHQHSLK